MNPASMAHHARLLLIQCCTFMSLRLLNTSSSPLGMSVIRLKIQRFVKWELAAGDKGRQRAQRDIGLGRDARKEVSRLPEEVRFRYEPTRHTETTGGWAAISRFGDGHEKT